MSETRDTQEQAGQTGGSVREAPPTREGTREGSDDRRRESRGGYDDGGRGGRGRDRGDRDGGGRRGGGRFRRPRRKVCAFCVDKVTHIDYKEHQRLREFVSDRGKILKSRMTGTCVKHQRKLASAVKRARQVALLPFVTE